MSVCLECEWCGYFSYFNFYWCNVLWFHVTWVEALMGRCRKYLEGVHRLVLSSWMTVTAPTHLEWKGQAERKTFPDWRPVWVHVFNVVGIPCMWNASHVCTLWGEPPGIWWHKHWEAVKWMKMIHQCLLLWMAGSSSSCGARWPQRWQRGSNSTSCTPGPTCSAPSSNGWQQFLCFALPSYTTGNGLPHWNDGVHQNGGCWLSPWP